MEYVVGAVVATVLLLGAILWLPWRRRARQSRLRRARQEFHTKRPVLQEQFFRQAAGRGKPRGLRWKQCEFAHDVTFARDPHSGGFVAFVGVTISFEAIEGGPMEDVEAVGNLRAGTAVFTYTRGGWQTNGRAVLNLDPAEAIERYAGELEVVED